MPTTDEILQGLTRAANHFEFMAIFWHLVFLILLILIISGKRPSDKTIAYILTLPMISVGVIAFLTSNPFNGILFLLLGIILMILTYRIPAGNSPITWDIYSIFGSLMIAFGWLYPHFIENPSFLRYLYAAPLGLIPCPTLSLVTGFILLFHGFHSKKWLLTLAVAGLFYGIVGILRLKVMLDLGLIIGAGLLSILWISVSSTKSAN